MTVTVRLLCRGMIVMLLALACVACSSSPDLVRPPLAARNNTVLGTGIRPLHVDIEPDGGVKRLVRALDGARSSLFVEVYILTLARIVRALERASAQGVDVYLLLEQHPYGFTSQPVIVVNQLRAAGVHVRWTRAEFKYTHAKFAVIDRREAVIGTANYSRAAFSNNREFLVYTSDTGVVQDALNVFIADWNRSPARLTDNNVVTSPDNSRIKLMAVISSAQHTLDVYAEEMADPPLERALLGAARHGVRVRVILPTTAARLHVPPLLRGHVLVRTLHYPYVHAKVLVLDSIRGFVGSENISATSLDQNREFGVVLSGSSMKAIDRVFDRDWRAASVPG